MPPRAIGMRIENQRDGLLKIRKEEIQGAACSNRFLRCCPGLWARLPADPRLFPTEALQLVRRV